MSLSVVPLSSRLLAGRNRPKAASSWEARIGSAAVLFLGTLASGRERGLDLPAYGGGITLVIVTGCVAVLIFQPVHEHEIGREHVAAHTQAAIAKQDNSFKEGSFVVDLDWPLQDLLTVSQAALSGLLSQMTSPAPRAFLPLRMYRMSEFSGETYG